MILNTHPENRKEMVKAICELTGMSAMYLFTPTYAYQVGPITVSRDGTIDCEDEAMLSTLKPMLIERGWLEAEAQDPFERADFAQTHPCVQAEQGRQIAGVIGSLPQLFLLRPVQNALFSMLSVLNVDSSARVLPDDALVQRIPHG